MYNCALTSYVECQEVGAEDKVRDYHRRYVLQPELERMCISGRTIDWRKYISMAIKIDVNLHCCKSCGHRPLMVSFVDPSVEWGPMHEPVCVEEHWLV